MRYAKYGWKYLLRFKEGSIPTIGKEAAAIKEMDELEKDKSGSCLFSNEVVAQHRTVNYLEQWESKEQHGEIKEKSFVYLTDITITKGNAMELAEEGRD